MGAARQGRPDQERAEPLSSPTAARVVPGIPSFSVDKGFWYSIPPHLSDDIALGIRVRIPLSGRRTRGFVVELADERPGKLKEIQGISGESRVFDRQLLQTLEWASRHYVAPLSVVLEKAAPPTLPKRLADPDIRTGRIDVNNAGPLMAFFEATRRGEKRPMTALVVHWAHDDWLSGAASVLAAGRTVLMIAATQAETVRMGELARTLFGERSIVVPDGNGAEVTRTWEEAQRGGSLVIGTPRAAAWRIEHLGAAVVIEEGRRAMKDRQTPTIHVRDLMRTRAKIEGFNAVFVGPTPSVELIAAGADVIQPTRPWGLVEVVDRREEPPGRGHLSDRAVAAIKSIISANGKAFVFTHRRAADASARCVTCRALRLCAKCGSHIGQRPACRRCDTPAGRCLECGGQQFESMASVPSRIAAELSARVGKDFVSVSGEGDGPIQVGTERDLADLGEVNLAVAVDVDALNYGQNYRSSEEGLRILARLVGSVQRRQGYRSILQTSDPDSDLVAALRRGEPTRYLESVLASRARDGFPPATEMLALEVRGIDLSEVGDLRNRFENVTIMGPVEANGGHRWLFQGDLGPAKVELRSLVQKLRDSGGTVRVDVDPIDL